MAQHEVLSPLPGIFYRCPAPEKPPYKEDGDIIGLIEVMKQFTEVHADAGGKVLRFLVDNEAHFLRALFQSNRHCHNCTATFAHLFNVICKAID
jgi:acetyl-CoA carboxylase biotin carboxyl carrier protein